jgi:CPA1 family monovalent cation:H+ antiporter
VDIAGANISMFALLSVLVSIAALFSFVSYRFLRLPPTVGVMVLSLCSSLLLIILGHPFPGLHNAAAAVVEHIDFTQVVLHGMLAFLLFAGSLHLDLTQLAKEKLPVATLAFFGTILSTVIVAVLLRLTLQLLGLPADMLGCFLFGALISPTDPIAVLEMLRRTGVPLSLETQLSAESLFNDGIGAVLFLTLLEAAERGAFPPIGPFVLTMVLKAGGGVALGVLLGYIVYRLVRMVDSYPVEVLLTLALAMGGYALADALGLSAPLEAVAAGLLVNGHARRLGMSPVTRDNVDKFWELIDGILNVILFLLLGLEVLITPWNSHYTYTALLTIPAVLFARWCSVGAAIGVLRWAHRYVRGTVAVLTWGGLRGGLAVALALSLGPSAMRNELLAITYVVVVFSILGQGLTMPRLLRRLSLGQEAAVPEDAVSQV